MDSKTLLVSGTVAGAIAYGGFSLLGGDPGLLTVALGLGATSVVAPMVSNKIRTATTDTGGLVFDPALSLPTFFLGGAAGGAAGYYAFRMMAPSLSAPAAAGLTGFLLGTAPFLVVYYIFRSP